MPWHSSARPWWLLFIQSWREEEVSPLSATGPFRPTASLSSGLPWSSRFLEGISSAQYGFEIQLLPQKGFQVKREQCVISGVDGLSYFQRSEDPVHGPLSSSSFSNLIPRTDSGSLVLPLIGGHKAFAPVVQALSAMRAYAISPERLRSLQDPEGTTSLGGDGSNSAMVLQTIIRKSPEDFELINEFIANLLPYKATVRPKEIGDKLTLEFEGDLGGQKSLTLGALSMSDGTLRTLGLLLAVYQQPAPTLIVLEEPDSVIHPGALGTILDVIKVASHRSQVVVTTHSPELLDASNWIEDRHLRIVYWEDGSSHVSRIGRASREALQEHLMGAGELLRSNVLDNPPPRVEDPPSEPEQKGPFVVSAW